MHNFWREWGGGQPAMMSQTNANTSWVSVFRHFLLSAYHDWTPFVVFCIGLSHKFVRFLLLRCLCVLIIFCDTSYVNIHIILIIYVFSNLLSTNFVYSIALFHSLSDGVPSWKKTSFPTFTSFSFQWTGKCIWGSQEYLQSVWRRSDNRANCTEMVSEVSRRHFGIRKLPERWSKIVEQSGDYLIDWFILEHFAQ